MMCVHFMKGDRYQHAVVLQKSNYFRFNNSVIAQFAVHDNKMQLTFKVHEQMDKTDNMHKTWIITQMSICEK